MEWALALVALALVVGLALARRAHPSPPPTPPPVKDELELRFDAVLEEASEIKKRLVSARLDVLRDRRVPLRTIRAAPGVHTARLLFANGTTVIAHARQPGQLYTVALHLRSAHVTLDSWAQEHDGLVLRLIWGPEGRAELVAEGLDQAD